MKKTEEEHPTDRALITNNRNDEEAGYKIPD